MICDGNRFLVFLVKRSTKSLIGVVASLLVLGVCGYLYVGYSVRSSARGVAAVFEFGLQRMTNELRPLVEADYVGRYDAVRASFTFRSSQQHQVSATVAESDLSSFVRSATSAPLKLIILYQAADFPVPTEKAAFESRIRLAVESAGASVSFGVTSPAQPPFP